MANQINVGIQRQSYEPFETTDSEAENQNADASLAGDSAGANTGGNPDIVQAHIDGESAHQAPPETIAANNTLNRYGIGDTVILGRPEYATNNREASVENTFAPNETAEMVSFAMPSESVSVDAEPALRKTAMPTTMPTGFVPTSTPQPEPIQICPNQTDLPSSGMETVPPVDAKPIGKATTLVLNPRTAIAEASSWSAVPPPPRDCAEHETARAFGAAHGYSDIKIDKLTALLYYMNSDPKFQYDFFGRPNLLSEQLDLTPVNADGTFDIRAGTALIAERYRLPTVDSDPGNRLRDFASNKDEHSGASPRVRGGISQGAEDYANEMTAAAPGYGSSYDYDDTTNTYDSPDSTYDDPGSSPQIDLNPLPSLPSVDSNGPMMLPSPDIHLDRELAPLPNIGIESGAERTLAPQGADAAQTSDRSAPGISETTAPGDSTRGTSTITNTGQGGAVSGNQPGNDTTVDASRPLYGYNADGQPLLSSGSRPSQGEYRAAPDAPSLMAGDPVLRADASGATPLRDDNGTLYYRVNGGAMDGQIIYVQPTTSTPQSEQPATALESGDTSLGFAPLTLGSTATSRLGAQLASQVLAAEMEFGPPQLRLAAAATLTGVALWAAGRQNTDYEALSPEERDRLRQPLINVPPPPLPPFPGLIPPPVPDNSILPGTSTQPNNLPPLGGFQIAPPRTIDDLIIESRRVPDGVRSIEARDPVDLNEFDRLNQIDVDVNRLKPGEASAATELQNYLGETLERRTDPDAVGDFVITSGADAGKTVDFMLTPGSTREADKINEFFEQNAASFESRLLDHVNSYDIVCLDMRFLTQANQNILLDVINDLTPEQRARIILLK